MSEPTLTSELKIIATGTAEVIKIKDKNGQEYQIQPLDLQDLCDYEDRVGTSLLALNFSTLKLRDVAYMVYLSLRKDGLSMKQIEGKEFKFSEAEMLRKFDLGLLTKSAVLITDLLRLSGLEMKANPQ